VQLDLSLCYLHPSHPAALSLAAFFLPRSEGNNNIIYCTMHTPKSKASGPPPLCSTLWPLLLALLVSYDGGGEPSAVKLNMTPSLECSAVNALCNFFLILLHKWVLPEWITINYDETIFEFQLTYFSVLNALQIEIMQKLNWNCSLSQIRTRNVSRHTALLTLDTFLSRQVKWCTNFFGRACTLIYRKVYLWPAALVWASVIKHYLWGIWPTKEALILN
jgi:hypothetical protein